MYFEQFPLFLLAYHRENRIAARETLRSCDLNAFTAVVVVCFVFVFFFGGAAFSSYGHQESASHFDYVHRSMRFHSYCHKCTLVA